MKKSLFISLIVDLLFIGIYFYIALPPINIQSIEFWIFVCLSAAVFSFVYASLTSANNVVIIKRNRKNEIELPKLAGIVFMIIPIVVVLILIVNLFCSPLFNASKYATRISVDETGSFTEDIKEVDFSSLPLLDRDSSEKLGDRVMGQMSELVSQYYVSNQYTQINYNNDIIRVTPLEYADFIKWLSNRSHGVKGYITVDSVNGNSKLIKLDKGMKYVDSAYFNENLTRKLRFSYPTENFGTKKFEIDNDGNPYYIIPTYGYAGVNLRKRVTGVIIFNPIDGKSKKYKLEDIPSWVDNAYNPDLIIEQVDNWGTYKGGFLNSLFSQKNVVNTTEGYNYLAMDDDVYLYTGITSVMTDESNLGFILSNMRTGKTTFYSVSGAEEYSAMSSAEGQVQQMKYKSTFPLLINLNGRPTYMVSLKDAAGLVKMYGFVDVEDYQKVVVTDSSKGIEKAAQNYMDNYANEISDDKLVKKDIIVKKISSAIKSGVTYYYVLDENGQKYSLSIDISEELPFISVGDKMSIGYYDKKQNIIEVKKLY